MSKTQQRKFITLGTITKMLATWNWWPFIS